MLTETEREIREAILSTCDDFVDCFQDKAITIYCEEKAGKHLSITIMDYTGIGAHSTILEDSLDEEHLKALYYRLTAYLKEVYNYGL